ncbi:hypothetical protein RHGRI_007749 [Rhododendron griersonianum]|uniref:Uncharacterized protein n=1 Tax=Rhododendron griersonianum TaxID=479676 RepID=A0AAV6KZB5_9ERIC|nr:hypothetical protein RHGRI_007749 [Rhododendron griersonianum]
MVVYGSKPINSWLGFVLHPTLGQEMVSSVAPELTQFWVISTAEDGVGAAYSTPKMAGNPNISTTIEFGTPQMGNSTATKQPSSDRKLQQVLFEEGLKLEAEERARQKNEPNKPAVNNPQTVVEESEDELEQVSASSDVQYVALSLTVLFCWGMHFCCVAAVLSELIPSRLML